MPDDGWAWRGLLFSWDDSAGTDTSRQPWGPIFLIAMDDSHITSVGCCPRPRDVPARPATAAVLASRKSVTVLQFDTPLAPLYWLSLGHVCLGPMMQART